MPHTTRESARSLASLANAQGGYFTAKQARDAGYEYPQLVYHVTSGNFERVDHGLYRLPTVPLSEHDELIRLTLWSRNQKDEPQAVVSHESALVLHDLSELLPGRDPPDRPAEVPQGRRRRAAYSTRRLSPTDEVEERAGFRVTSPASDPPRRSRKRRESRSSSRRPSPTPLRAGSSGESRSRSRRRTPSGLSCPRRQAFEAVGAKIGMAKKFTSASAFKSSLEARLRTRPRSCRSRSRPSSSSS